MEKVQKKNERKIDRFDIYMKYKGLNDNRVTNDLAISVGIIGKSRKEGRDLSANVIEKILNFYKDLSPAWLLTGSGEMLDDKSSYFPPKSSVQHISGNNNHHNTNEGGNAEQISAFLELLKKKDEQIDRLLTIIERR